VAADTSPLADGEDEEDEDWADALRAVAATNATESRSDLYMGYSVWGFSSRPGKKQRLSSPFRPFTKI
jgi:hypothetical protein